MVALQAYHIRGMPFFFSLPLSLRESREMAQGDLRKEERRRRGEFGAFRSECQQVLIGLSNAFVLRVLLTFFVSADG